MFLNRFQCSRLRFGERAYSSKYETSLPIIGKDSIMIRKVHGSSNSPCQTKLKFGVSFQMADRLCNFNRKYAEPFGYWKDVTFLNDIEMDRIENKRVYFYDSVSGDRLFVAPTGRSWNDFILESTKHGWPSFRDSEVIWDYVRVVDKNEVVSVTGTHLGHNIPDESGNRYCINLCSISGSPILHK